MRKIFLTTLVLAIALGAIAQNIRKGKKGDKKKGEYAWVKENLNLTDQQKADLDSFKKEMREERKGMKDLAKTEKREKAKSLKVKLDENYKSVLTTEQYASLEKHREEVKAERAEKRKAKIAEMDPEEMATKRLEKLKEELGLTDEQVAELKPAHVAFFTTKKEVAQMPKDTEEEKEAAKAKMKTANKDLKAAMDKTLTQEQKDKMKESRKGKKGKKGKKGSKN